MERKIEIPALILLILIVGFFYFKALGGFFVQDEWYGFGWYLAHQGEGLKFFLTPSLGHYNPLTDIISSRLFFLWGLDYFKFACLGIGLHLFTTLSVYFLAKIVLKKITPALFAALAFGVFASPYQGVTWVVTNIATLSSSLFGVISAILFFKKRLFWSLILLIVSLLFKEITIGLFALYFLLLLPKAKKNATYVTLLAALYVIFRVFTFSPAAGSAATADMGVVIYNFLTLPLKSVVQTILPSEFLKSVFRLFSPGSERIAFQILMEIFVVVFGFFVFVLAGFRLRGSALLGLGWVILNSLVFSASPGVTGVMNIVDSRNLYFTAVGAAIFLASIPPKFSLLAGSILILNIYWLNKNLDAFVATSEIRRNVLEKVVASYTILPEKVIFYTESDSSYYGLPRLEPIVPFQSGFGQTLLIYYSGRSAFPKDFYPGDYLWGIKSQGYEEHKGRGFGYFRDKAMLKDTLKKYKLPPSTVIAFSWSKDTEELRDISDRIRHEAYR